MADALVMACEQYLARGPDREGRAGPPVTVVVHVDEAVLEDPSAEGCAWAEGVGAISVPGFCLLVARAGASASWPSRGQHQA